VGVSTALPVAELLAALEVELLAALVAEPLGGDIGTETAEPVWAKTGATEKANTLKASESGKPATATRQGEDARAPVGGWARVHAGALPACPVWAMS
jgi:hypothetical protein